MIRCRIQGIRHPDLRSSASNQRKAPRKPRTELVIEQIRELSEQLALTAADGGAQVVIIDPADAINQTACNALLKTLEEPVPGRYLWLVTAHPARLPATIRSRCQRLELRLPPRDEALAWLLRAAMREAAAQRSAGCARGHPGLAR